MARIPRANYFRRRRPSRLRHSVRFHGWVANEAERLEITTDALYAMLVSANARVVAAEPTPEAENPEDP